jgi:hypothetical protein
MGFRFLLTKFAKKTGHLAKYLQTIPYLRFHIYHMSQDIPPHNLATNHPVHTEAQLQHAVLAVLRYFEIFKHPLTNKEIEQFLPLSPVGAATLQVILTNMVAKGQIWHHENMYLSQPAPEWVGQRQEKNQRALQVLPKAYKMGHFIGRFPFVKAVMVSGSLSKQCMPADGDVDFFIITQPGRLWLARTLLVVFKKVFLLNSHKFFCINYLIDTDHLEVEEKNLFTATECATLLPVYNKVYYERFMAANQWVHQQYYPQMPLRPTDAVVPESKPPLKRAGEWLLSGRLGQWADHWAMRFTVGFWRRKFRHFDPDHFELALKSRRYVSKHHPLGFQNRVLRQHDTLMQGGLGH